MAPDRGASEDGGWPGMAVVELKAEDLDREAVRAVFLQEAREAAEQFPVLVEQILAVFRDACPLQSVTPLAIWGLAHGGGPNGFAAKGMIAGVEQHHVELVQALLLTLDRDEWGHRPATAEDTQRLIDAAVGLATAFNRRRRLQIEDCAEDADRLVVVGLQERVRDYTQMVRNWSTHSEMVDVVRSLHAPLDAAFARHHGFSASDLVEVVDGLVKLHGERINDHFVLLKDVFRARTREAVVRGFFDRFDAAEGDPDDFLASVPRRATLREVKMVLRDHADRRMVPYLIADPTTLGQRIGKAAHTVARVLAELSFEPGALRDSDPEHIFLANPVWARPGMRVAAGTLFFSPQGAVSFLPSILRELFRRAGLATKLERRRAEYLESAMESLVRGVLPSAQILSNRKWSWRGVKYETDLIAVVDRIVVIGEAKSGALSAGAMRGAPNSVRDRVQDLLLGPAEQSERLRDIVLAARSGDPEALQVLQELSLDIAPDRIDRVIRLSVTLDDFSALSSAQPELKRAGWMREGLVLPPTMQLAELRTVIHILDDPAYFLNYLTSREALQGGIGLVGFELDFLGAYLRSGLDLPEVVSGTHRGVFRDMSQDIDGYAMSREAGYASDRPSPEVDPFVEALLSQLRERGNPGWMSKSLALLDAVPPGSANGLGDVIDEMAARVARDPDDRSTLALSGPGRRAIAVLHVFPYCLNDGLEERLRLLAEDALDGSTATSCVVFARMLERWDLPFQLAIRFQVADVAATPRP